MHQLVQAHGGTVDVNSEGEGKGSTFTIVMPDRADGVAGERSSTRIEAAPTPPGALRGVRLLVVDDDEDSRDLLACLLEDVGATVASASSASEAIRLLQESPPDVLLSDIGMPEVDGYAFIRKVRGMPSDRGGKTPAIALTAYARTSDGERALAAGFQAHVTKPVDPDKLTAVIASLAGVAGP